MYDEKCNPNLSTTQSQAHLSELGMFMSVAVL